MTTTAHTRFCNESVDAALGIAGDRRSPQDLYEWGLSRA